MESEACMGDHFRFSVQICFSRWGTISLIGVLIVRSYLLDSNQVYVDHIENSLKTTCISFWEDSDEELLRGHRARRQVIHRNSI
jgi:hypothetical protein